MDHYMHRNNYDYNLYHQDVKNKNKNKQANKQTNKKERKI